LTLDSAPTAPIASPGPSVLGPGPSPGLSPSPAASARPTRTPVPTPVLKPGEVITWIRLERPRLPLGEILASSFAIIGLVILAAVSIGLVLGYFKSRGTGPSGTGLHLR
jgi:hypothetical protein